MKELKVFLSSVQNEMTTERLAILEIVSEDGFLRDHIVVVRFEDIPAETTPVSQGYIRELDKCDVYIGIIGNEYGEIGDDGFSPTQREYDFARLSGKEIIIFIKGDNDSLRDEMTQKFIRIVSQPDMGHKYKRFANYVELKKEVHSSLLEILAKNDICPTPTEQADFEYSLQAGSDFDIRISRISLDRTDEGLAAEFAMKVSKKDVPDQKLIMDTFLDFGLAVYNSENSRYFFQMPGLFYSQGIQNVHSLRHGSV